MNHVDFSPVIELMENVGGRVVSWRTDSVARRINSERELKTEADLRAHDLLMKGLNSLFPGVEVISEEDMYHDSKRPDNYWLIDPIDGTASWYHGFDGFVTQAAYIERDTPIFGIVHAPIHKNTWTAVKGCGARLNNKPLQKIVANERVIFTDNTKEPQGIIKKIMGLFPSSGYLECGSLGLKSVLVAIGRADLFVKDILVRDWDLAPAAVILGEVGGCLALATGKPYVFNGSFEKASGFIVARDPELMNRVLEVIKLLNLSK